MGESPEVEEEEEEVEESEGEVMKQSDVEDPPAGQRKVEESRWKPSETMEEEKAGGKKVRRERESAEEQGDGEH